MSVLKKLRRLQRAATYVRLLATHILLTPIAKMLCLSKHIWIVSERGTDARDNGYHLYRYIRKNHPEQEAYYIIDRKSADYPKVAARIISKDPGNWYDTFMINKGSKDGIRVDNNVIAGKGLVGIVTEVGSNWATVRSIIDDSSNVSAMTVGTDDNCVVEGDLELIDEGKLRFTQLYDKEDKVTVGEQVVTSNISEKYVEGLFIGYVSDIQLDTNNLTKSGTIVTPVDFQHLKDVFVITVNKKDSTEEGAEE